MPIERETIIERPSTTETVVTSDRGSTGVIVGVIVAVLAVIAVLWLVNGGISSNGGSVNVDLPSVTVTD
ncbi:hypothetical protein SAMN05216456_3608 [Devosia crocina]|uniref:Uncharacterized protein n=1 Tax=Devosia crocina TaxID=429728 RepID=A0A1I7NVU6_9HYPH|nr:hypothetical protein [Devosia crocina]SFV38772.1 hypothetical protein SAMN05216456_3608 [Devosia crocina]